MIEITSHLETWLEAKSANTAKAYRRSCQDFLTHTHPSDLAAVTPGDIFNWKLALRQQKRSDQTIVNSLSRLSRFFDYAIAHGIHPGPNPARHEEIVRPRASNQTGRGLTLDQVRHALRIAGIDTATGARASALILVALTGVNPLALRWGDSATLPPAVTAVLNRYATLTHATRSDDAFVFVAWKARLAWQSKDRNGPITRAQVSDTLGRLSQRAGFISGTLSIRSLLATVRSMRRTPRGAAMLDQFLAQPVSLDYP